MLQNSNNRSIIISVSKVLVSVDFSVAKVYISVFPSENSAIILKEVNRGGQVFFVDNSVENLKKTIVQLKKRLPFLTFGLIYSKMNKKELLASMNDFIFGKTQVLLSTSIIESGIDISLANTIIINNAHMFGLSQLYQLRGRVGRSTSQAFAWFLIPQKNPVSYTHLTLPTNREV